MIKLYVNFNFLRITCEKCNNDLIAVVDLRKLKEQIIYECTILEKNKSKHIELKFKCNCCQTIFNKKILIERKNNVLFVE